MSDYDNEIADHTNMFNKICRNERVTLQSQTRRIKANKCQCSICGTVIESKHTHDFVQCACGRIFTDGGKDYIRRGFQEANDIIDLTEFEN